MKYLALALVILVSGFFIPMDTKKLILTPNVNKVLQNISSDFDTEMGVCLRYTKWGPFVITHSWQFPVVYQSTPNSVRLEHCAETHKIFYHNHPPRSLDNPLLQNYYYRFVGEYPEDTLYLSRPDTYFSKLGQYHYMIVGGGDQWAWWSKDQIHYSVIPSIDEQTHDF